MSSAQLADHPHGLLPALHHQEADGPLTVTVRCACGWQTANTTLNAPQGEEEREAAARHLEEWCMGQYALHAKPSLERECKATID